jgi:hypothetical protein
MFATLASMFAAGVENSVLITILVMLAIVCLVVWLVRR